MWDLFLCPFKDLIASTMLWVPSFRILKSDQSCWETFRPLSTVVGTESRVHRKADDSKRQNCCTCNTCPEWIAQNWTPRKCLKIWMKKFSWWTGIEPVECQILSGCESGLPPGCLFLSALWGISKSLYFYPHRPVTFSDFCAIFILTWLRDLVGISGVL